MRAWRSRSIASPRCRESVDAMGDIVWAIDPHRDTPAHLAKRMRRFASDLLPPRGIELRFDSAEGPSPHLSADVRRQVYLIDNTPSYRCTGAFGSMEDAL